MIPTGGRCLSLIFVFTCYSAIHRFHRTHRYHEMKSARLIFPNWLWIRDCCVSSGTSSSIFISVIFVLCDVDDEIVRWNWYSTHHPYPSPSSTAEYKNSSRFYADSRCCRSSSSFWNREDHWEMRWSTRRQASGRQDIRMYLYFSEPFVFPFLLPLLFHCHL